MPNQYQTSMITSSAENDLLLSTVLVPGVRVWNNFTKKLHIGDGATPGGVIVNTQAGGSALTLAQLRAASPTGGPVLYDGRIWTFRNGDYTNPGIDNRNIVKQDTTAINVGAWTAGYGVQSIVARTDGNGTSETPIAASIAAANTGNGEAGGGVIYKPPGVTYIGNTTLYNINKRGIRFNGPGIILQDEATGNLNTRQLVASYADEMDYVIAREYSVTGVNVMAAGTKTLQIDMFGDSTTGPFAITQPAYVPDKLLQKAARDAGYSSISIVNNQVDGSVVPMMDVSKVRATSHIIVINYGVNDMGQALPDPITYFYEQYDAKLTAIRAAYPYPNAASIEGTTKDIYILAPNSCNSWGDGRAQFRYEQLRGVMAMLARKHKCTFIDKYAYAQDSTNAKPWMDENTVGAVGTPAYQTNVHIHPTVLGNDKLWGIIGTTMFKEFVGPNRSNTFHNLDQFVPCLVTDLPSSYVRGFQINRMSGAGWPFAIGWVITTQNADGLITQRASRYEPNGTGPPREAVRSNNAAGTWGPWSTDWTVLVGTGGWAGDAATRLRAGLDGKLTGSGAIAGGAKATGTQLFVVPAALRPAANDIFMLTGQVNASGTGVQVACLITAATGAVTLYGATTADTIFLSQFPGTIPTS